MLSRQLRQLNTLASDLLLEHARGSARFAESKRLLAHGRKLYSQHDEDGIIEEIFARIGETNKTFVEFGVGDGLENCTLYPLLKGWNGVWIEGGAISYVDACKNLSRWIEAGRLKIVNSFITAENIEELFAGAGVPAELDLLSIDIDNNDYWIWKAIQAYSPRVVAIEYNASFGPTWNAVIPYEPTNIWNLSNYYGASLKAIESLGRAKGYSLVGCNYTGVTAFLVRDDLMGDRFAAPFTSENHYESARYHVRMQNGHPPGIGPVVPG